MKKWVNPTLEDVARAASVSTATISRVLNEPHKVSQETRNRIQDVIQELGYIPNFGGRMLAMNRSNLVGAIIPTMANAMFASGLQAFQETLSKEGVTLLVASSGYDGKHELQQIRSLLAHGASAFLLIGDARPQESVEFLALRQVPYVLSWCYQSGSDKYFAGFDNRKAAYNMAMAVLNYGHRRIAMIAGISEGNDRAGMRIEGVKQAIVDHGDGAELMDICETKYSLGNGGDVFEQLMTASDKPTAIICGNDVLAAGAIVRARQLSIAVPKQVSITGFDDITLATVIHPMLTTVRVHQKAMGCSAAQLLLELLFERGQPRSVEIETEIVHRDSLAAPHSA